MPSARHAAVVVVAVLVAGGVALSAGTRASGGPVPPPYGSSELAFDVDVSSQPWDGEVLVENTGRKDVILDGIRLVGRTPGLRLVAAYSHHKADPYQVIGVNGRSWPPGADARPYRRLDGTRVQPSRVLAKGLEYVQVIIRLKAPPKPMTVGYRAVDVRYHVGGTHHTTRFQQALTLCVLRKGHPRPCPGPTGR